MEARGVRLREPAVTGFRTFPTDLTTLGSALFKYRKAKLLSMMESPRAVTCLGKVLTLTQHRGDDSIARLLAEFKEEDIYGIVNITSESPLVLDIGGNIGFISILTQLIHPNAQVIVFEPSPITYFFLRVNLKLNKIHVLTLEELQEHPRVPGVYPVFGGVGAKLQVEFASMSDSERVKTQSQNGIVDYNLHGDVPVYNLKKFLTSHGLNDRIFDVVKLDCECCEYKVIPDSNDWITNRSKVKSLTGEIHGCNFERKSEQDTLDILRKRGCVFPAANFDDNNGRFRETANLNEHCVP